MFENRRDVRTPTPADPAGAAFGAPDAQTPDAPTPDAKTPDTETTDLAPGFRAEHAELYGRLLAANEQITRTGRWISWLLSLLWAAVSLMIVAALVPDVFGVPVGDLQSGWTYVILAVVACVTYFRIQDVRRTSAYAGLRGELIDEAGRADLTQATLLAALGEHDPVGVIAAEIKADGEFDGRRRR